MQSCGIKRKTQEKAARLQESMLRTHKNIFFFFFGRKKEILPL